MIGSTRLAATLAVAATLSVLALGAGATTARAATGCGIVTAAGHPWIVVTSGVSCATAKRITRGFAARTAALTVGHRRTVTSPLHGFYCLLANHGKPGGSCATPGAVKSILWIVAA